MDKRTEQYLKDLEAENRKLRQLAEEQFKRDRQAAAELHEWFLSRGYDPNERRAKP